MSVPGPEGRHSLHQLLQREVRRLRQDKPGDWTRVLVDSLPVADEVLPEVPKASAVLNLFSHVPEVWCVQHRSVPADPAGHNCDDNVPRRGADLPPPAEHIHAHLRVYRARGNGRLGRIQGNQGRAKHFQERNRTNRTSQHHSTVAREILFAHDPVHCETQGENRIPEVPGDRRRYMDRQSAVHRGSQKTGFGCQGLVGSAQQEGHRQGNGGQVLCRPVM